MIPFGSRIEMFVDDFLIDKIDNLSFRYNSPTDHGKVIGFDEAWEAEGSLALTVLEDEENIKLYYRGFPKKKDDSSNMQTSCLAVSNDGITFTRYPVNEIAYYDVTENNIVFIGKTGHNFAPFYDTNPKCKSEQRYKAIGGSEKTGGIWAYSSPDGIHWNLMSDRPILTEGTLDTMNMAFWNPATGKYHCYTRYWEEHINNDRISGKGRAIQSCVSDDFINWSGFTPNQYEEGPIDELYTNAVRPVPGAEHVLISFPMRFNSQRKKVMGWHPGVSDAIIMTSRDGVKWSRPVKDAWLSGRFHSHEWTHRSFITAGGIISRDDNFYLYVEKNYMWDDGGIWLYSVPKYRFMSLYADGQGGELSTKLLKFETDDIYINYSTSSYGYVIVKIFDELGEEIYSSDELFGNALSDKIHVEGLHGKCGTISIYMKEAHIYAIGSDMN